MLFYSQLSPDLSRTMLIAKRKNTHYQSEIYNKDYHLTVLKNGSLFKCVTDKRTKPRLDYDL